MSKDLDLDDTAATSPKAKAEPESLRQQITIIVEQNNELAGRIVELRQQRDQMRQQLTQTRDWFEAQAKSNSKGNLSAWDLMILRDERDAINKVLGEFK